VISRRVPVRAAVVFSDLGCPVAQLAPVRAAEEFNGRLGLAKVAVGFNDRLGPAKVAAARNALAYDRMVAPTCGRIDPPLTAADFGQIGRLVPVKMAAVYSVPFGRMTAASYLIVVPTAIASRTAGQTAIEFPIVGRMAIGSRIDPAKAAPVSVGTVTTGAMRVMTGAIGAMTGETGETIGGIGAMTGPIIGRIELTIAKSGAIGGKTAAKISGTTGTTIGMIMITGTTTTGGIATT
jgi:hypothetical protein